MINCRVCNNQEYHGVFFCGECGSQLVLVGDKNVNTFIYPSQERGLELDITNTIPKKLPTPFQKNYWKIKPSFFIAWNKRK